MDKYALRYLPLFYDDQGPQKIMEVRRILYSMRNIEKLL